jgi:hypothetical protein
LAKDSDSFAEAQEVLRLLVFRADEIRGKLKEKDIKEYLFLMDRFNDKNGHISRDEEFQRRYGVFYGLYAARLADDFKSEYFKLMEELSRGAKVDLAGICNRLKEKGGGKLQFSFCTKMAATLDPEYPIYDVCVAEVFHFDPPLPPKPYEERVQRYLSFYDHLRATIKALASRREVSRMNPALRDKFPQWSDLSSTKQLDFLIWTAGKLLREEKRHGMRRKTASL